MGQQRPPKPKSTDPLAEQTPNFLDLLPGEADEAISHWVAQRGLPGYRARQIHARLWERPVPDWGAATELPRALIAELEENAPIRRLTLETRQISKDGTQKSLWRLDDGLRIESVWIPEGRRATLCISSQAGCAFGCLFCATGTMGFQRNLAAWEITGQVREAALDPTQGQPTNVVFMGMGEPLHNWDAVNRALTIINDPRGLGIGARRITVSTIGIIPRLRELARRPEQFRLAVSLHAARSERRAALMPIERKYPVHELTKALRDFRRRITFEYVMIEGANDSPEDAEALAQIAEPLRAMVNLLPLHPTPGSPLRPTSRTGIERFATLVRGRGTNVTVRRSRGLDIKAACGQLRVLADQGRRIKPQNHRDVHQPPGIRIVDDPAGA